ncbi:hypothetical protein [Halorubrum lipolyticum]|uniref:DUF8053 domain-containing protein n=1 Tax=Halorubrum lipolyticum DSM 21995 TaxID=1227482 RepID=M0NJG0_9EURY|nr:hypothetical protein [Halorubrum lipolyticum]EMA57249.1 hypothetical protein C469_15993 [Halorubrum lipolyticum DSM 21995]
MSGDIRKLRDLGNGSGGVVIPKELLREWGLVDDDDELVDAHLYSSASDGVLTVQPLDVGGLGDDSQPKRSTGRSIPASKADL